MVEKLRLQKAIETDITRDLVGSYARIYLLGSLKPVPPNRHMMLVGTPNLEHRFTVFISAIGLVTFFQVMRREQGGVDDE